jgi:hypothetical protein
MHGYRRSESLKCRREVLIIKFVVIFNSSLEKNEQANGMHQSQSSYHADNGYVARKGPRNLPLQQGWMQHEHLRQSPCQLRQSQEDFQPISLHLPFRGSLWFFAAVNCSLRAPVCRQSNSSTHSWMALLQSCRVMARRQLKSRCSELSIRVEGLSGKQKT